MNWPEKTNLDDCLSTLLVLRSSKSDWNGSDGLTELRRLLTSSSAEEVGRGLLTCAGLLWGGAQTIARRLPLDLVEQQVFQENMALCSAAAWAWGWKHERQEIVADSPAAVLDRMVALSLSDSHPAIRMNASIALQSQLSLPRRAWNPVLNEAQLQRLLKIASESDESSAALTVDKLNAVAIGFHAKNPWPDDELARQIDDLGKHLAVPRWDDPLTRMLGELGETGRKYLTRRERKRRK